MTYRIVCEIKNNQVVITLPPNFEHKNQVVVYLEDESDSFQKKMDLMRQASTDPLFLADLNEVAEDFDNIDSEHKDEN